MRSSSRFSYWLACGAVWAPVWVGATTPVVAMPVASGVTPAAAVPMKATLTVAAASATVTAAKPHHDAHHAATHGATGAVQAASAASAPASKHPAPKKKEATPKADKAHPPAKPAHPVASASSAPASAAAAPGKAAAATKVVAPVAVAVAAAAPVAARALTSPVFVLNSLDGNVSVIDPTTWTEIRRVPTGKEPHHLYLTPDQKSMIVANALGDSLTFFDPRTGEVQREIRGILDPYQLRFSPDMKWFVTAANRLNHIDIYRWDGKDIQLAKRIPTGKTPSHVWIDTKSTMIWSSMQDSDELVGIDLATQTLKWRVKTGSLPADVFVTPDDKMLLVGLTGGKGVEIYDVTGGQPAKFIKLLPTGEGAHSFRAAGDKRHVFVSNRVANTISKIDYQTMTVVETFPVPSGPDDTEISPDGKTMMIASRWAKRLTVMDLATHKIIREVPVGKSPHGVWTLDHAGRQ